MPQVAEPPAEEPVPQVAEPPSQAPARKSVDEPLPQLRGRIVGADLNAVVAVVVFGPDNILREAARVAPDSGGRWSVSGLAEGKYRVQLDGGGRRSLVTDPPFVLIDVKKDDSIEADEIRLLKAL
jgi:hypothetical protein